MEKNGDQVIALCLDGTGPCASRRFTEGPLKHKPFGLCTRAELEQQREYYAARASEYRRREKLLSAPLQTTGE